jgi:hypothetical protein
MFALIRNLLLLAGIVLPILKAFGVAALAGFSWPLVFTPLLVWLILLLIRAVFFVIFLGGFAAASAALSRR